MSEPVGKYVGGRFVPNDHDTKAIIGYDSLLDRFYFVAIDEDGALITRNQVVDVDTLEWVNEVGGVDPLCQGSQRIRGSVDRQGGSELRLADHLLRRRNVMADAESRKAEKKRRMMEKLMRMPVNDVVLQVQDGTIELTDVFGKIEAKVKEVRHG